MSKQSNNTIEKNGWGILGFVLLCYFIVALIATLEGAGGLGVAHSFSGKQSFFIPAAVLPAFFIVIAIGVYWLFVRVKNKHKRPNILVERGASRHSPSRPSR